MTKTAPDERKSYVLSLDDDPIVPRIIEASLGITTLPFTTAEALLSRMDRYDPIAVFVDVQLGPTSSGLDVVPQLREQWPFCPILVVSIDPDPETIGAALAAGANDFMRKPIHQAEIVARLKTRMAEMTQRRERAVSTFGPMSFSLELRTIAGPLGTHQLSQTEALILDMLMKARGLVVSKDELRRRVCQSINVSASAVDKKIHDLRQAVRRVSDQVQIAAKYGVGISIALGAPSRESEGRKGREKASA